MNRPALRNDLVPATKARFTTDEFRRMNDAGAFEDMRVELVDGELERMNSPQSLHARLQAVIMLRMGRKVAEDLVHGDGGVDLGNDTVLGCDAALLHAPVRENRWLTAADILLAIEISVSTLGRDMGMKRMRYGNANIANYWVVDGERSVVHVHAKPVDGEYTEIHTVRFGDALPVPGTDDTITID